MRKKIYTLFILCLISVTTGQSQAASLSFDIDTGIGGGQIEVTVLYDFTDLPAFGGGFNMIYDPTVLEFESYTQAVFSGVGAPQAGNASPLGSLDSPGNYLRAGVGTFEFFTGINTAGPVGTFVFTLLGTSGDAGCGIALCLTPDPLNPFFSLTGQNITDIVFNQVPLPAAVWFMLTGLLTLVGIRKRARYFHSTSNSSAIECQ